MRVGRKEDNDSKAARLAVVEGEPDKKVRAWMFAGSQDICERSVCSCQEQRKTAPYTTCVNRMIYVF